MRIILINIILFLTLISCSNRFKPPTYDNDYFEINNFKPKDTLFRVSKSEFYEMGDGFAFVNQKGDTIIPYGKFYHSFSDTIVTYGVIIEKKSYDLIGINQNGERIYEIYKYDNGPDYISDGLFRILRDGKIGYADKTGKIIIEPQFECASTFLNGIAEATYDCYLYWDLDEHLRSESKSWFNIDKNGKRIK